MLDSPLYPAQSHSKPRRNSLHSSSERRAISIRRASCKITFKLSIVSGRGFSRAAKAVKSTRTLQAGIGVFSTACSAQSAAERVPFHLLCAPCLMIWVPHPFRVCCGKGGRRRSPNESKTNGILPPACHARSGLLAGMRRLYSTQLSLQWAHR